MSDFVCNCGNDARYTHIIDNVETYSCNKYVVCCTYKELYIRLCNLNTEMRTYKKALRKIVRINAMDYEYKAYAKEALVDGENLNQSQRSEGGSDGFTYLCR